MPKFFVTEQAIQNNEITMVGKDINHIKNVLRKKVGDTINICNDDKMMEYLCEIVKLEENKIICHIIKQLETNSESNIKVSIFQGLPKADKMELVIQKTVELGVYDITPVEMKRCVVRLDNKDKDRKSTRLNSSHIH